MSIHTIITIGRQCSSGGREIGKQLAEALDIPFYDRELINRASKDSGIAEELMLEHEDRPTGSLLYSLVMDTYSFGFSGNSFTEMPLNQKIFLAQYNAIKAIAEEGPCVIVGRCADYALENREDVLKTFIHAPLEDRIPRFAEKFGLPPVKAKDRIIKTDKQRANFYNYYSSKKWGHAASYDLTINSALLGIDGTVALLRRAVEEKEKGYSL